jgi:ATP-binding cassette subfamily C protein CydC
MTASNHNRDRGVAALWQVFRLILRDQSTALIRGAALSLVVLIAGIALLGLSGWFITAAAAAGLAGMGAVFDVFRPSAMVRFLALGRTAARYGERLLTHDATLRALTTIRVRLLAATASAPHDAVVRLRGPQALNRLMADVDALDGIPLRLILPLAAGIAAQLISFAALWWLVDLSVALWIAAGFLVAPAIVLARAARTAARSSGEEEAAAQAFRSQLIDLIRARDDLAAYGQLTRQGESVLATDAERQRRRGDLDRIERRAGFALSLTGTVVAAGALAIGMMLARNGTITPALAAIGFFASLALMETIAPLRRAMADLGRMTVAAQRVAGSLSTVAQRLRTGFPARLPSCGSRISPFDATGRSSQSWTRCPWPFRQAKAWPLPARADRAKAHCCCWLPVCLNPKPDRSRLAHCRWKIGMKPDCAPLSPWFRNAAR